MIINEPLCGFDNCKFYFDGNCTNKTEYEHCEYTFLLEYYIQQIDKNTKNEEVNNETD